MPFRTKAHFVSVERIQHSSGEIRFLESRGRVLLDSDGQPYKLVGVCQDVTTRMENERIRKWQIDGLNLLTTSASGIMAIKGVNDWTPLYKDVARHLGCDAFANYIYRDSALHLTAAEGLPGDFVQQLQRLELGEGMCGLTALGREFLYAPRHIMETTPEAHSLWDLGFRMFVGVPLVVEGQLLGTLSLVSSQRTQLNASGLEFAQTVGQLVSAAVSQGYYQKQIAENEQHFRAIVDNTADALIMCDLEGKIVDVNRETCESLGYGRNELLTMDVRQITVDMPSEFAHGFHSLSEKKPRLMMGQHRHKDGSLFNVEGQAIVVDHRGQKVVLTTVRDTTERLEIERQRRQAEETSRLVLDHAKMVTWKADPETLDFHFLSGCCVDLLGFENERWRQPGFWAESIHPNDVHVVIEKLRSAQTGSQRIEYRMKKATGEYVWVETIVEAVVEDGIVTSLRGVLSNIDFRKTIEERLQHTQKMEAIGRLAGGVAHDFNNLLTVINTYADLLNAPALTPSDVFDFTNAIQDAVQRAKGLTDQLLVFGRNSVTPVVSLDINTAVEKSQRLLTRLIGEDIRLNTKLQPNLPAILANPSHVDQMIMNLAVNARDAMPHGGCLYLETSLLHVNSDDPELGGLAGGSYVQLMVADTGCGMSEEVRCMAFEPFFSTKPVGQGSGLGLSVIYGIVHEAGGEVLVNSTVGEGTEFRILLPVSGSAPLPSQTELVERSLRGAERLLLVEDDHAVRRAVSSAFRRHGYEVVEASCASEAVQTLVNANGDVALMVTDLVMPDMGGLDLADEVRSKYPKMKILCVSGYSDDRLQRRETDYEFLQKPFTNHALLSTARRLLDS